MEADLANGEEAGEGELPLAVGVEPGLSAPKNQGHDAAMAAHNT